MIFCSISQVAFLSISAGGVHIKMSITTMYLAGLVCIFIIAALLHLPEAYCLLHGIWYLWCLPAGAVLLMAYSVANLDDRSWGTREEKKTKKKTPVISMNSFHDVVSCFKKFFVYDWRSIVRLNDMSSLLHIRVTSTLALQDISF